MTTSLSKLSNDELLARLKNTCRKVNLLLGDLIRELIEVEERRLHLEEAYPSLFEFCRIELGFSESEAYRRCKAAKLVQRFPQLLEHIERGDIHLTTLLELRNHFTESNVDELVSATRRKSKEQVAELVARLAPRPDVPAKLRKLPQHDIGSRVTKATKPLIDPLSEGRYRLQLTGSREFRDKLLRARDLMMRTNPNGDLAVVVERALDELLHVLEKRVFGESSRKAPLKSSSPAKNTREPVAAPPQSRSSKTSEDQKPGLARTSATSRNGKAHERRAKREGHTPSQPRATSDLRQRKIRRAVAAANGAQRSTAATRVSARC